MLGLDPRPVIIAEVVFSNIGGIATGMCANYKDDRESGRKGKNFQLLDFLNIASSVPNVIPHHINA